MVLLIKAKSSSYLFIIKQVTCSEFPKLLNGISLYQGLCIMNKFDYVTGYLPEDNILDDQIKKTGRKTRRKSRKVSRIINKGLFYAVSIASVATVAVIISSYMGMGESISASSKPVLTQQETEEQPIWLSMGTDEKKNTATKNNMALSSKNTVNNHYDEDLDRLLNNAYSK